MLATRTSEQPVSAGEENTSKPDASSTVTLLPPAALTANMVRRGRDPWWGEDQHPKLKPGYDDAAARLARARAIFESTDGTAERSEISAERSEKTADGDVLDLGMSAIMTTADGDSVDPYVLPESYLRTERRSSSLMRDVAIFLTVLMASCVVTLYVSLQLD